MGRRAADNLTLGLAKHSARRMHRLPLAIAPAEAERALVAVVLHGVRRRADPDPATETPQIGYLAPTADYDTIMDRLLEWVAFTPLQNATGDPAISLPLATTAAGLPHGMMFAGPAAARRPSSSSPTSSRSPPLRRCSEG